ncbi:uncharacterized protein LOC114187074 [Vigna unguiculata]|uniref:VQ domain-containing protein n=1 Tax=Vigna unguiculata TaxID=3917 RepID=A0A4D6KMT5_VIGUN|nr:uncharacterized protein LOC114187074 [Vigna unguiculata]QCD78948.1 hypothetical protein DEO72_LG1g2584 [Vigna unguiculata]
MTQTMSGPNDWLQFYNQNPAPSIPDFTVTTTSTAATVPTTSDFPNTSPSTSTHLGPEGRVGKPTRRRSRASRRTPTTLLNTDTTNFRAMVQQFTGGPNAPFAPSPSAAPQVLPNLLGFGFPSRPIPSLSPTPLVMSSSPPLSYHHLQQGQHHQQQQNMFQQQNQHYNLYSDGGSQGEDHNSNSNMFFQRLSNNPVSPPASNVIVSNNNRDGVVNLDQGRFFPNTSS